jgi:hypothetical protein
MPIASESRSPYARHGAGRLTLEEFSERVERAYAARTGDELEPLTADLPGPGAGEPAARRREPTRSLTVIFGGGEKLGRWRIGRRFFCFTMLGGSDIDLRQAEIAAPEVAITAFTMWGGFDIYVPEGVEVDVTGFALFGGNSEHGSEHEVHRDAPVVRIKLITIFGGSDVWHVPLEAAHVPFRQLPGLLKRKALRRG